MENYLTKLRSDIKHIRENQQCQLCAGNYHLDKGCKKCNSCLKCCRSWKHPLSMFIDFNEFRNLFKKV